MYPCALFHKVFGSQKCNLIFLLLPQISTREEREFSFRSGPILLMGGQERASVDERGGCSLLPWHKLHVCYCTAWVKALSLHQSELGLWLAPGFPLCVKLECCRASDVRLDKLPSKSVASCRCFFIWPLGKRQTFVLDQSNRWNSLSFQPMGIVWSTPNFWHKV